MLACLYRVSIGVSLSYFQGVVDAGGRGFEAEVGEVQREVADRGRVDEVTDRHTGWVVGRVVWRRYYSARAIERVYNVLYVSVSCETIVLLTGPKGRSYRCSVVYRHCISQGEKRLRLSSAVANDFHQSLVQQV